MIKYKIIEYTANAIHLLGYAKHLALGVIQTMPQRDGSGFTKSARVGDIQIKTRGIRASGDWIVRLSMIGVAKVGTIPLVRLGSTTPIFAVSGNVPAVPGNYGLTAAKLVPALLPSKSISYVDAYLINLPAGYVLANTLPGIAPVADPQAGSIAVAAVTSSTIEFHFDTNQVWVEYSVPGAMLMKAWSAISILGMVEPSSATFSVPVDGAGVAVAGTYVFALPMADARFTMNTSVVIDDGAITTSTALLIKDQWKYTRVSHELAGAAVTITYTQQYNSKPFYLSLDTRVFVIPPDGPPLPNYPQPAGSFSTDKYAYSSFVGSKFSAPESAPAYVIEKSTFTREYVWDMTVPLPGVPGLIYRDEGALVKIILVLANGSYQQLVSGPRYTYGTPASPPPGTAYQYVLYGQSGESRTVGLYVDTDTANDRAEWVDVAGIYSVRRHRPNGIPIGNEQYDVLFGGDMRRSALRGKNGPFTTGYNESYDLQHVTITSDSHDGYVGLTEWSTGTNRVYTTYDESFSIAPEMLVVMQINITTLVVASITVVMLPFGWGTQCAASYRNLETLTTTTPTLETLIKNMRDEMQAVLTLNTGFADVAELAQHVNTLNDLLIRVQGTLPPGTKAPTRVSARQELETYFTPFVKYLSGKNVSARTALAAGTGTFLLVGGAKVVT